MFKKLLLIFAVIFGQCALMSCDRDEPEKPKNPDEATNPVNPDGPTSDASSGIYLGVVGFNQEVYEHPVEKLTRSSLNGFTDFISELTMKNGTLLYYSVDQALTSLKTAPLPSDLATVAIVTFTDGLDQGSMMKNDKYADERTYLDALQKRISTEKVRGKNITAYSIGIRGNDVSDVDMFRTNLVNLASSPENAIEVTSMSEVTSKFQEIAERLSMSNYFQTINLKMPGLANGTRVRFTFDGARFGDFSSKYIEGRFNLSSKSLEDVTYYGMTSTSGSTVKGTVDGIFVSFVFDGVHTDDNLLIENDDIDEWTYVASNDTWQINSEFDKSENSEIRNERSSAAIMLVLDCSSSLGSQFATAQTNARRFVNTLCDAAGDMAAPDEPAQPDDPSTSYNPEDWGNDWLYINPDKVTSNDCEPSEGSIAGLFDNDYDTFFHSGWRYAFERSEPYGSYLDIEFEEQVRKLKFEMIVRNSTIHVYPCDIDLYWSNDRTNWSKFAEIRDLPTNKGAGESVFAKNPASSDGLYTAPQDFKYLRFCVIKNSRGESLFETSSIIYWHLAELRFYDKPGESSGNETPSTTPAKRTYTVKGVSFNMISVDGGTYQMGSNDGYDNEKPVHSEAVETFYIGETEVTQELWKAVMDSNPSYFSGTDNLPVEDVSWNDCQTFISKLNELTGQNFRLPTEAEWEYAARGGNQSKGYTYSGSNTIGDVAWYYDNSNNQTHAIARKLPNELGLYDMSGNVWEWCSDWYSSNYSSPRDSSNRVIRGGGWGRSAADCRVAGRGSDAPDGRSYNLGLRLAL